MEHLQLLFFSEKNVDCICFIFQTHGRTYGSISFICEKEIFAYRTLYCSDRYHCIDLDMNRFDKTYFIDRNSNRKKGRYAQCLSCAACWS